jgi:hypothetical protein
VLRRVGGTRLARDERGDAYIEYLAILACIGIVAGFAMYALGFPLIRLHRFTELVLSMPIA